MNARHLSVAVASLACVAFLPALGADFVNLDDEASFLRNIHYRGLGFAQLKWMFTTTLLGHWSPLTWMTWGFDYVVGGMNPFGYHLTSVLLHAVNVALFLLVARRLLARGFDVPSSTPAIVAGAVFAALVFGVHPLRAESVAWLSGRRDVLCATFYLLATLAYLRGVSGGRITPRWWAASILAFAAALLSKALGMTLPLTLLLMDVYPLRRRGLGWRTLILEKAPYAVLAVGAAVIAIGARQEGGNITDYGRYGVGARIALIAHSFWFYPWKSLWPTALSPHYELPASIDPSQRRFVIALVVVVAITVALVLVRRRWPAPLAAWLSCLIVLAPVSGAVHSGEQLAADRYSYLACLGLAVLAGAALAWAMQQGTAGRFAPAVAAVIVVALGVGTWQQAATWRNSETLWRHAVQLDPNCSLCVSNLGRMIAHTGRLDEAEALIARAIALRPDRAGPHENMGVVMLARGRVQEATTVFRRVVSIRPVHGPARNNLGVALAEAGRDAEAEKEFREAARLSPQLPDAPANLGALYLRQGRFDDAVPHLRRAMSLDPTRVGTAKNLERALAAREAK